MIVWLASYPRSGNTFLRMVLHFVYGQKTYSLYNDPLLERDAVALAKARHVAPHVTSLGRVEVEGRVLPTLFGEERP